jgi:hypothetical protein
MDIHYGVRIAFFLFIGREIDFNRQIAVQLDVISAAGNFDDWNIVSPNSPIAKDLVQSSLGLGWTYVTNVRSFLFWFFTAYIIAYLIIGLYRRMAWARRSGRMRLNTRQKLLW